MAFDWERFFREHRVEYVTHGPNTAPGELGIKCPWCGSADPSQHMSVSPRGRGYVCRRNRSHGGKDPVRLVQALLRCSFQEAQRIVGLRGAGSAPTDVDALDRVRALLRPEEVRRPALKFPAEFRPMGSDSRMEDPFWYYLEDRGYSEAQVKWMVEAYDLHYVRKGPWAWRIIIPLYDRREKLLAWTARTILPDKQPRYKMLRVRADADYEGPVSVVPATDTLLGLPLLWKVPDPTILVLCEGPFDAIRISAVGRAYGVYATCTFGLNISTAQVGLIMELQRRFRSTVMMLDPDAELQRLRLRSQFTGMGIDFGPDLPPGVKDPGDLSTSQALVLCQELLEKF